jgi:uncharacterized DUF497 family protein
MRCEWDDVKNQRNLLEHDVRFETAIVVFEDPYALTEIDALFEDQERRNIASHRPSSCALSLFTDGLNQIAKKRSAFIPARLGESLEGRKYEEAQQGAKTRHRRSRRKTGRKH